MFKGRSSADFLFIFALVALINNVHKIQQIKLEKSPDNSFTQKNNVIKQAQNSIFSYKQYQNLQEIITELRAANFTVKAKICTIENLDPQFLESVNKFIYQIANAEKIYQKKDTEIFILGPITALSPTIKERTIEKRLFKIAIEFYELLQKLTKTKLTIIPENLQVVVNLCIMLVKILEKSSFNTLTN
jgi:uncharacterized membrane protein